MKETTNHCPVKHAKPIGNRRSERDEPVGSRRSVLVAVLAALVWGGSLWAASPVGTAFTYQGRLNDTDGPATGYYDFFFSLYDSASGETGQIGLSIPYWYTPVTNGLFTVNLDFGNVFTGNATWLQIHVRTNGSVTFTSLSPRQPLTPAPNALYASSAGAAGRATNVVDGAVVNASVAAGANILDTKLATIATAGKVADTALSSNIPRLNGNPLFTSIPAFNGGESGASAPFSVDSTFAVGNLNADLLDGVHAAALAQLSANQTFTGIPAFNGGVSGATAPFAVDSTFLVGNLNADFLDGQSGSWYQDAANLTGTLNDARLSPNVARLDLNQTFNGRPSFNGGVPGVSAPFSVDSTFAVGNLNADLLDGVHATALAQLSADQTFTGNVQFNKPTSGQLVLHTLGHNDNQHFTLKWNNNSLSPLAGDDTENQLFGFYSAFAGTRSYDAQIRVYGKATSSWGNYIQMTHNGTNGFLSTDTGHLLLSPAGNVGICTNNPQSALHVVGTVTAHGLNTPPASVIPVVGMVWIQPGTFILGSRADELERDSDEGPQTVVTLTRGFWMGVHEVTQAEYLAAIGSNPSYYTAANGYGDDLNRPVEMVSWNNAVSYCGLLTTAERTAGRIPYSWAYRLPTEAEWEYGCRAGARTTRYGYGDDLSAAALGNYAWYLANSGGMTHPVEQKLGNAWGLMDMHGNVWEWCQDWFGTYPGGSVTDPQGPGTGSNRVIRSGSMGNNAKNCRAANRHSFSPGSEYGDVGFRVVLAPVVL